MSRIRLIVEDDTGRSTEQIFELCGDLDHLDSIDEAVEDFKNTALPQVEQQLLLRAHDRALAQEKKTEVSA